MSSACLGRQISLNSPRFMRSSCVSCECFANSLAVREKYQSVAILKYFFIIVVFIIIIIIFHNSNLEYFTVAVFV